MTENQMSPPAADDRGPIFDSPDVNRSNGFIRMLRRVLREKSLAPLRRYVFVPADPPGKFAQEALDDLAERLRTDDHDVAQAVLAEAEAIFQEPIDRIEGAERRATTLQGAVAVAASVVIAGSGLLLDPSKVTDRAWRIVFGGSLFVFVFCLTASAMRALGSTSRIFRFQQPGPTRIADRAEMGRCDALTHRAAELLRASEVANQVGRVKVGLLRSAAWWFRLAILSLTVFAALIAAYTIAGPEPPTPETRASGADAAATSTPPATPRPSASPTAGGSSRGG